LASLHYYSNDALGTVCARQLGRSRIPGLLEDTKYDDYVGAIHNAYNVGRWHSWAASCKAGKCEGILAEVGE
jgi:hypothetical protein